MDLIPDKYFTICTEDAGMDESNFTIYDATELSSIDSGDGETIVYLKDKETLSIVMELRSLKTPMML